MARRLFSLTLVLLIAPGALLLLASTVACRGGGGGNEIIPTEDVANSLSGRWTFRHSNGDDVHLVSCAPGLEHLSGLSFTESLAGYPQYFTFEELIASHDETRLHFFVMTSLGNGIGIMSSRGGGTVSGDFVAVHVDIIDFAANTRTTHSFSGVVHWPDTIELAQATFFVNGLGTCSFTPPLLIEAQVIAS